MRNTEFDTSDVKKRCEDKLGIDFRIGDHYTGWYLLDGVKRQRISVAMGKKFIPPKTYKTMVEQLGLTVEQFDNLLACPLDGQEYENLLRGKTPS